MADKPRKKTSDDQTMTMSAGAFRDWRKRLGLRQKEAADLLGLKKRMIQYYETGSRDGKDVTIPKSVRLACYALEIGVGDYDGEFVQQGGAFDSRLIKVTPGPSHQATQKDIHNAERLSAAADSKLQRLEPTGDD